MQNRIMQKWRPPLYLVLGGVLSAVLAAPIAGLLAMRVLTESYSYRHSSILVFIIVCLVAILFGFLLWRLLLRPITALSVKAETLRFRSNSNLAPLKHYGTKELRDLGESVLAMAEVLHNRETTIRTYTDHVTHELKSQITAINGAAELLENAKNYNDEDRQLITTILSATEQMNIRLAAMREISAAREPSYRGNCKLSDVLPELCSQTPQLKLHVVNETVNIPINCEGLRIILRHMFENALAHNASQLKLQVKQTSVGIELVLSDDGDGISSGNIEHVFEPFFTTKRDNGGTGMGLCIVKTILQTHGGDIKALECAEGATFHISF